MTRFTCTCHLYTWHTSLAYRLKDPLLSGSSLIPLLLELSHVLRKDERLRNKVTLLLPNSSLKSREIPPKSILSANLKGPWEMINLHTKKVITYVCIYITLWDVYLPFDVLL